MPKFSAFTPFGHLKFSGNPSYLEIFYKLLPSLWGSQLDFTVLPSYNEAKLYATARAAALALLEVEKAGNQANPNTAYDLLPLLELDYLIVPGPSDTVPTRQKAVAAAMRLVQGEIASNVVALLRLIAGAAFLAYVPGPKGLFGATVYPTNPGSGPGAFKDDRLPAKRLQLVDPVVQTGVPTWVAYQALDTSSVPARTWSASASYSQYQLAVPTLTNSNGYFFQVTTAGTTGTTEPTWPSAVGATVTDGSAIWTCVATIAPALAPGDVVVVDAGNTKRMEKVTVTGFATKPPAGANVTLGFLYMSAVFTSAHDETAAVTTGSVPYWWSTQRLNYVILAAASAVDSPTRAKIDALLAKVLRGTGVWATLQPSSTTPNGGTVGPLSAGAPMGCVPVGTLTFTNSN